MTTRLAETTRGGVVESVHAGTVVVAAVDGSIVATAGDPGTFAFFRSSAKPFQAIPLIESGAADHFGFTPAELALCCASHHAEPRHQRQVEAMLAKLGLDSGALQCGIVLPADEQEAGRILAGQVQPSPLQCDCSGKHTGMLASCLQLGYPIESYLEPNHPLQRQIRTVIEKACRVGSGGLTHGVDGCSLPTFGSTVQSFALAFATLAAPAHAPAGRGREHAAALERLRAAMIGHPENVAGEGGLDTTLMAVGQGKIVAKSGAEGLLCVGLPERGVGIAIRIADGSFRAHPAVVAETLRQLDAVDREIIDAAMAAHDRRLFNHNRRHVGEIRAAFQLKFEA
jgi:L-asparaginase II